MSKDKITEVQLPQLINQLARIKYFFTTNTHRSKICLPIIAMYFSTLFLGCNTSKYQTEATQSMRMIYLGIDYFSRDQGSLPPMNKNTWRWSNIKDFEFVPWRGKILSYIAPIGVKDASVTENGNLDTLIHEQISRTGSETFSFQGMLVEGNFWDLENESLSSLPSYFVIAYTVIPTNGYQWSDSQTSNIHEVISGESAFCRFAPRTVLLFANGSVGLIPGEKLSGCKDAFDQSRARMIAPKILRQAGVVLME